MVQPKRSPFFVALAVVTPCLLIATLALSIVMSGRLASSSARIDQTMLVKLAVAELFATLSEAEAGERGYVLTGRAEYLEPYRRARSVTSAQVERLSALATDDEAQRARATEVAHLTAVKLDELEQAIDRRDRDGRDAAIAVVDTGMGLHTMDALRGELAAMETVENLLLARRRKRQRRYEAWVLDSLVVTSALFGLCAGLAALVSRTADARRRFLESEGARLSSENQVLAEHKRAAELQERFAGILGHDLRNPLSSITMGLQVLRRDVPSSQRTIDRMVSSAARMARMIDQLLDLTRSRLGGGIAIARASVNLGKLVAEVSEEARAAHPEHTLLVEMEGNLDGEWDPDRLAQVVSNLIGNAIAYGLPGGTVRVAVRGMVDTVELEVKNAGEPIPESVRGTLFDPFRRGHPTGETPHASGLGLGLYIVREIVVAHGGVIDLVSTDASGTTFRVVLPRGSTAGSRRP